MYSKLPLLSTASPQALGEHLGCNIPRLAHDSQLLTGISKVCGRGTLGGLRGRGVVKFSAALGAFAGKGGLEAELEAKEVLPLWGSSKCPTSASPTPEARALAFESLIDRSPAFSISSSCTGHYGASEIAGITRSHVQCAEAARHLRPPSTNRQQEQMQER